MRSTVTLLAVTLLAVLLLASQAAMATITFTQLDDDVFSVSHRVKIIGSRSKATKMVYTKAASLCIAAGFSHYRSSTRSPRRRNGTTRQTPPCA